MKSSHVILVTGAAGWIGRKVCEVLQTKGCFVLAVDLKPGLGPWDAFHPMDLTHDAFPEEGHLLQLCDGRKPSAVIHCAGLAHQPVETVALRERFFAVNAGGTRRVIQACKDRGISRLVYVSSIAFYDWEALQDVSFSEEDPLSASTAYAASKLEGERAVLDAGLDGRVARLATVFGEGDPANFAKLAKALKTGRFIVPGLGSARKSVISVDLAAEMLVELALREGVPYPLMNVGLLTAPTLQEICDAFADHCGFPVAKRLPLPLFRLLAFIGTLVSRVKPGFPLTLLTLRKLTNATEVDCRKAAEVFPVLSERDFARELQRAASYYQTL